MGKTGKIGRHIIIAVLLALSLSLTTTVPAAATTDVIEVSQPVQVTSNAYYERGQSITYDGTSYWLFYGRSASVTGNYQSGNPDLHDYCIYYKKAGTLAGLAADLETAVTGTHNNQLYLGETDAAYFNGEVWVFASYDTGSSCDLYAWHTTDGGSWTETGPIVTNLPVGAAHFASTTYGGELWIAYQIGNQWKTKHYDGSTWSEESDLVSGYGTGKFYVEGSGLYFAVAQKTSISIYQYSLGVWSEMASKAVTTEYAYDAALFKKGSIYMFVYAPLPTDWSYQWIKGYVGTSLSTIFSSGTEVMTSAAEYGGNTWVEMWPIGFTDIEGNSYLFYTSERNPVNPASEITGNIWYLPVTWDLTNDHFTYVKNAIEAATSTTINVAPGVYPEGQCTINSDISIVGNLMDKPVIQPFANITGDSSSNAWFLVSAGITFSLSNVVLDGNDFLVYQAIRSHGYTTIDNVDLRTIQGSISGSPYRGIGISCFGGTVPGGGGSDSHGAGGAPSTLSVIGSTFEQMGRIGILVKGTESTAQIFSCFFAGKGNGDWLDYACEAGAGGTMSVKHCEMMNCTGVASVDGSTSAGILVTTYWGDGTKATIVNNEIHNNTYGIAVGYDEDDTSVVTAHCNNIVGNTSSGINSTAQQVDAENNWWGHYTGPSGEGPGSGDGVSNYVNYDPWLCGPWQVTPPCGTPPPPQPPPPVEEHGAPVGIEVYSVNKSALLAPWIALAVVIIAGAIVAVKRRRA